ncbi:agarase [Nocardia sp. NPDC051570]|uniref:agarase n=1 Tax=Nocardia sp. NPDC051570 TaxID=3364324 RepID=UPI0037B4D9F2
MTSVFGLRRGERWWLTDPRGADFLSIGVVHADDTNLRFPHNAAIFAQRYGNSRERWIRDGLAADLRAWGFNTIGWTSEYVSGTGLATTGKPVDIGHSAGLSADELSAAGLPYTISLRVAEIEHWNGFPAFRDPREPAFAQWCDYLARTLCRPDDPNLLGYFLVDVPSWEMHPTGTGFARTELKTIAHAYYRAATEAIRRHDPQHLILGDRYGLRAGVPEQVLDIVPEYVDVLSVQAFPGVATERIAAAVDTIAGWHRRTGLPVLMADTGNWCPTRMSPHHTGSARNQAERGLGYTRTAEALAASPWCVGWHWCGWVENPLRGFGIKDPWDEPYTDLTEAMRTTNARILRELTDQAPRRGGSQQPIAHEEPSTVQP